MVCQGMPGGSMIVTMSAARSQRSSCSRTWSRVPEAASWSSTIWAPGGTVPRRGLGRGFAAMIALDLGGVALAGQGAGVDVAHGAQVPGDAAGGDVPGRVGVLVDHGERPGRHGERSRVLVRRLLAAGGAGPPSRAVGPGPPARGSSRRRARRPPRIVCGPSAATQMGTSGAGGWPRRSGRAAADVAELGGLAGEQRADLGHASRSLAAGCSNGMSWNPSASARVLAPRPST